jgi:hypothetical protein
MKLIDALCERAKGKAIIAPDGEKYHVDRELHGTAHTWQELNEEGWSVVEPECKPETISNEKLLSNCCDAPAIGNGVAYECSLCKNLCHAYKPSTECKHNVSWTTSKSKGVTSCDICGKTIHIIKGDVYEVKPDPKQGHWEYCEVVPIMGQWVIMRKLKGDDEAVSYILSDAMSMVGFGGIENAGHEGTWYMHAVIDTDACNVGKPAVPKRVRFWVEN